MSSQTARRESPLVSVVVPTCDRRAKLEWCLKALARQTYPNYEVVVVDDCSADDTPTFLDAFARAHPHLRLKLLRNETHAGANPSRNRGILAAEGELTAFIDSDCAAEPDWLEQLVQGFTSRRVAAVTGLVEDTPPKNIYDLTFRGTHRLSRPGPAHRLAGTNMCVRRELLLKYRLDEDRAQRGALTADGRPDVTVSGRGDEEGLFLLLRAAGYEQRVVPAARVTHDHGYNRRSFFRQAYRGGMSAARLVHKYYLPHRRDLLPLALTYLTLPLVLLGGPWPLAPLTLFLLTCVAYAYNDIAMKGKTPLQTLASFPMLLAYYHVRLFGYARETLRLALSRNDIQRMRLSDTPREAPDA